MAKFLDVFVYHLPNDIHYDADVYHRVFDWQAKSQICKHNRRGMEKRVVIVYANIRFGRDCASAQSRQNLNVRSR